jgi:hypothetical protein
MLTALVVIQSITLLVTLSQYSLTSKFVEYIIGKTGGTLRK